MIGTDVRINAPDVIILVLAYSTSINLVGRVKLEGIFPVVQKLIWCHCDGR